MLVLSKKEKFGYLEKGYLERRMLWCWKGKYDGAAMVTLVSKTLMV